MGDGWLRCVTDANLWIDLLHGEIENRVFSLPWKFIAPDVVLAEILLPYSWKLQGLGLIEMELSGTGMHKAEELVRKYPRPGRRDILSLVLAMQERAMLLTGDEALRKAASEEGIEVHGTLWLLDAMVKEEAISKEEGCRSLEKMLDAGRRLPKKEVSARIAAWSEFVRHR
jgi:predicted nucleic acid-binding protein